MRILVLCCLALCAVAADPAREAAEFDTLIDAELAKAGQQPQPPAEAATLVRRRWLDLAGRLPTPAEAAAAATPQAIIGSEAWRHAVWSWLADVLRVQSRLQDRTPGIAWIVWLDEAVAGNTPWDAMVREQLTASGPALAAGGGATGFALRDAGMPLDHAALTSQTFLGTRIGCAQCHDHPYDRWERIDFLRFAAFSADARSDGRGQGLAGLRERLAKSPPDLRNATRAIATLVGAKVQPARKDWLEVPKDWKQDDGRKPGERIAAEPLFHPAAPAAAGDPRQRLAAWMTAAENRRFALAIGNRVWKRVFGLGLIEPVDDLRGDPDAALPPLQDRLARLVVDSGYDLQRIHLVLASTRHYARAVWNGPLPAAGGVAPGRPAARLSANAWWDSLVALSTDQPDRRVDRGLAAVTSLREQAAANGVDSILAMAERFVAVRKGGAKAAKADPELAAAMQAMRPVGKRKPGAEPLLRASQLAQPAPPGHPLRILGQADRELIDDGSDLPAATQALLLMNGIIDEVVLAPGSRLMRDLAAQPDESARIARLWQEVLVRAPSAAELAAARAALAAGGRDGLADLAWALLNGSEFRMMR